jgi:adenylate cyclase
MSDTRRLSAILIADIAGYSRRMGEDELGTLRALKSLLATIIEPAIARNAGRVVKRMGDGILAEFASVVAAVRAGLEMQESAAGANYAVPSDEQLRFRVGIHLADVIVEGDDIFGDGVNIAARLEGLAEPGGICVSEAVYAQIAGKLAVSAVDLGVPEIKNIAQPIRLFALKPNLLADATPAQAARSEYDWQGGFSHRPAFAVLPFDNLSGDPQQECFADGFTDDLISALGQWRWFPVIARNSTFTLKGKAVDAQQAGRLLGARYLLQGSVRRAGARLRINAQLVEARSGHQLWSKLFDRRNADLFEMQDDIARAIVASVEPELSQAEERRAVTTQPAHPQAYDDVQRGNWHVYRFNAEDNALAENWYRRAIERDPAYSPAHSGLAYCLQWDASMGWRGNPTELRRIAFEHAQKAVALDEADPKAHSQLALASLYLSRHDEAIGEARLSLNLNPSFALAYSILAYGYDYIDRYGDAVASFNQTAALRPNDRVLFRCVPALAIAHYQRGEYAAAAEAANKAVRLRPDFWMGNMMLAASLAQAGRASETGEALTRLRRSDPAIGLDEWVARLPFRDPADRRGIVEGLRRAAAA